MLCHLLIVFYLSHCALTTTNVTGTCEESQTSCRDESQCVLRHWICDGEPDCPDASDEEECDRCQPANFLCKDQSRCIPYNWVCDYNADCSDGSDEACSDPSIAVLILNENGQLGIINATERSRKELETNTSIITAMTFDSANSEVYWSSIRSKAILKMDLEGQNITTVVNGCSSFGMDIDSSLGLLFYTDRKSNSITKLDIRDGNSTIILNRTDVGKLSGILVDPANRRIFWTDDSGLYMADYDGMNIDAITTDVDQPSSLALGVSGREIYWLNRYRYDTLITRTDLVTRKTEIFPRFTRTVNDLSSLNGKLYIVGRFFSSLYATVPEHKTNYWYHQAPRSGFDYRFIKAVVLDENANSH